MDVRKILAKNADRLSKLYGAIDPTARYEKLADEFTARFGRAADMFVSAPGRIEVVGNHTDHNHGRVLAASVNLDTLAAVAKRDDAKITLYSAGYDLPFVIDTDDLSMRQGEKETTYALIRGVAARIKELGYKVGGFDACVNSTVFKGSGLSSSAAFEVLIVGIFDALFNGWTIPAPLNAEISQYAENVYFGKPSGLMDQMASAVGGFVAIDFGGEKAKVEAVQFDFAQKGYQVCVVAAGGDHGNLTDQYAAIPQEMAMVARALGKEYLNQVSRRELDNALATIKNKVPDRAILRAMHFVDETRRAREAVEALKNDDIQAFFAALIESGESSWKLLQNLYVPGSENQEMALALAMSERMLRGKGAWRINGGGFAGTILAFVPGALLETYRETMDGVFGRGATVVLSIRPEGCAQIF